MRVHAEVEPVQVERVHVVARVDDAPPHRIAHVVRQALGVRPRTAVDREQLVEGERMAGRIEARDPALHHEHAIRLGRRARGIHDQGAVEVRILVLPVLESFAARTGPVVVRPLRIGDEAGLPRLTRRDHQRVHHGHPAPGEAVDHERRSGAIRDARPDLGAGAHAQQRSRILERLPRLAKGEKRHARMVFAQRVPVAQPRLDRHGEDAAHQPARGGAVVVELDRWSWSGGRRVCAGQADEARHEPEDQTHDMPFNEGWREFVTTRVGSAGANRAAGPGHRFTTSITYTSLWRSSMAKKIRPPPTVTSGRYDGWFGSSNRTRSCGAPPAAGMARIDALPAAS